MTQTPSEPEPEPEPAPEVSAPDYTLRADGCVAEVYCREETEDALCVESRCYVVSDGVTATSYRASGDGAPCFFSRTLDVSGTLWYHDAAQGGWVSLPLAEGTFASPVVYLALSDGTSFFFALPRTFAPRENDTREYLPDSDGLLRLSQEADGLRLTLEGAKLSDGRFSDCLIAEAPFPLLDWELENCAKAWVQYVQNGDSLWCYDGYYRKTAYNYIPTGENYYYCCPASYTIKGFLSRAPKCNEATALSILMLDTMSRRQNADGFWPTTPGSEWLQSDYGIGAGFYDTRFNTDLIEIYLSAAAKFGQGMFDEVISRYFDFYAAFAEQNHTLTENGGWLVPDYWHSDPFTTPHTSLNHQLAECLALYHAAELYMRDDLHILARRLLQGLADTSPGWVMPDRNLYYSILPDGTYLTGDYPYLTYNDLYDLREYLTASGEEFPAALASLMENKLLWMQSYGITGYKTD